MENDVLKAKSIEVRETLEQEILTGRLRVGARMYSSKEIMEKFGLGKTTALKILKQMEENNILYKKIGKGYYIKPFAVEMLSDKYKDKLIENADALLSFATSINLLEFLLNYLEENK